MNFFNSNYPSLPTTNEQPTIPTNGVEKKHTKSSEKKLSSRNKTSSSVVEPIEEEKILVVRKSPEKSTQEADSFASIFTASLNTSSSNQVPSSSETRSTITDSFEKSSGVDTSSSSSQRSKYSKSKAPVVQLKAKESSLVVQTSSNPFLDDIEESANLNFKQPATNNPFLEANNPFDDEDENSTVFKTSPNKKQAPAVPTVAKNINNFPMIQNDEEDNIEWDSSEDEEIVKKEIASFERHQVFIYSF